MTDTIKVILQSVVEGLTEFLPISSTGHMILTGTLMDFTGSFATTFDIVVQLGAILAVVVAYPWRFVRLIPRPGDPLPTPATKGLSGLNGLVLLAITTIPALLIGFVLHHKIEEHLFFPGPVAIGLTLGAIWILVVEGRRIAPVTASLDDVTWKQALVIGCFQCVAMWPGISRSASTIMAAMMMRVDRRTATEYSFFASVPVMCAATLYKLFKERHNLHTHDLGLLALGFVIAFVVALVMVKWLIHFVSKHTLRGFAYYRLAAVVVVIAALLATGYPAFHAPPAIAPAAAATSADAAAVDVLHTSPHVPHTP